MTFRTSNKDIISSDFLYIHPDDAIKTKLKEGEQAKILSKYGTTILPIKIDDRVREGECFATFNNSKVFINKITGPYRDKYVQTPEYKITSVRIEKNKKT
ncbi:putative formate dehydrogenase [compost metagenome]